MNSKLKEDSFWGIRNVLIISDTNYFSLSHTNETFENFRIFSSSGFTFSDDFLNAKCWLTSSTKKIFMNDILFRKNRGAEVRNKSTFNSEVFYSNPETKYPKEGCDLRSEESKIVTRVSSPSTMSKYYLKRKIVTSLVTIVTTRMIYYWL